MRALRITLGLIVLSLAAGPAFGQAASDTNAITATLTVAPVARLSLSGLTLTFPDANPDDAPVVTAAEGPILITARARATPGSTVTLTVQALDDLRSGTDVIPASAVSWTATGSGFVAGTLSATAVQTVGNWPGSGVHTGSQAFSFQNAWSYVIGTYTLTVVYTLTAL